MKISTILIILLLIGSCQPNTPAKPIDYSNTKELTSNKTDVISFRKQRNRDIVGHLYNQAVENDPNLRSLDQKIQMLNEMQSDSLDAIEEFRQYNALYYTSANQYALNIMDSSKREQILKILEKSNDELQRKWIPYKEEVRLTTELVKELMDQHSIMKILISENLINGYQNELPDIQQNKNLNQNIHSLLEESKKYSEIGN